MVPVLVEKYPEVQVHRPLELGKMLLSTFVPVQFTLPLAMKILLPILTNWIPLTLIFLPLLMEEIVALAAWTRETKLACTDKRRAGVTGGKLSAWSGKFFAKLSPAGGVTSSLKNFCTFVLLGWH